MEEKKLEEVLMEYETVEDAVVEDDKSTQNVDSEELKLKIKQVLENGTDEEKSLLFEELNELAKTHNLTDEEAEELALSNKLTDKQLKRLITFVKGKNYADSVVLSGVTETEIENFSRIAQVKARFFNYNPKRKFDKEDRNKKNRAAKASRKANRKKR